MTGKIAPQGCIWITKNVRPLHSVFRVPNSENGVRSRSTDYGLRATGHRSSVIIPFSSAAVTADVRSLTPSLS